MQNRIPDDVQTIIDILEGNGFEAFAVGGCVRDMMMGNIPHDWDIATNAHPEEMGKVFRGYRVMETGLKHGTVTLRLHKTNYEITTYRIDGEYLDNRRPSTVSFTTYLFEDLKRRDFTINAMALHPDGRLYDAFNGRRDIEQGIIRCVGNPDLRFQEDALRIMRALRFASVLDFQIEPKTAHSLRKSAQLLEKIAAERIAAELRKLLCGAGARRILEEYADVVCLVIPEIKPMINFAQHNPHHDFNLWEHTLRSMEAGEGELVRLVMLFHDIGKPDTFTFDEAGIGHFYGHAEKSAKLCERILRRLKMERSTIDTVTLLVKYHGDQIALSRKSVKRWLNRMGEHDLRLLLKVKRADILGQAVHKNADRLTYLDKLEALINEVIEQRQCFSMKDLAVNGKDLLQLGYQEGSEIGRALSVLMELVLEEQVENSHDCLIAALDGMKENHLEA